MTRNDLIAAVKNDTRLTKAQATAAVDSVLLNIPDLATKGGASDPRVRYLQDGHAGGAGGIQPQDEGQGSVPGKNDFEVQGVAQVIAKSTCRNGRSIITAWRPGSDDAARGVSDGR